MGRRIAPLLAVLALWLLGTATLVAWLKADNFPPAWDVAWHTSWSLTYRAAFDHQSLFGKLSTLASASHYYPPLVHACGAWLLGLFGTLSPNWPGLSTADVVVLTNIGFMGLMLFGTYAAANRLYGARAGVVAAFLVLTYPILAGQSRLFLLDYPLTGLAAVVMALLLASRGLTHRGWVWPLGLALGLAVLCKWSFAFLVFWPLAVALGQGWLRLRSGDDAELTPTRLIFNVGAVLAAALVVAGPWYLSHLGATLHELGQSDQTWRIDGDPLWCSPAGLTYYARCLLSQQIFLPLALLGLAGTVRACRRWHRHAGTDQLLAWVVLGMVMLTPVANKDPRFSMPLLPALAVLTASLLASDDGRWRPWQGIVAAGIVLLGLLQWQGVATGIPGLPARVGPAWAPFYAQEPHLARHPSHGEWPHEALARDIARVTPAGGRVGVVPNAPLVSELSVRYWVQRQMMPYLMDRDRSLTVEKASHQGQAATVASLVADRYDSLLLLTGRQGVHAEVAEATMANLRRDWNLFAKKYALVSEYKLPEGETISLYELRLTDDKD
ncbi:MAG: glycosyltransferase family 39 protein [Armatimonadetes bacterium]|nr:glycosyltransferase family 39 protein [Armatimonadota bacterium]